MSTPTATDHGSHSTGPAGRPVTPPAVPCSTRTRERGLAHIAAIKAQLAARAELAAPTRTVWATARAA